MLTVEELDFLRESNNIEDEWDDRALQDAILAWQYCKSKKKLSAKIVCEVHSILMQSRNTIDKIEKGVFRKVPVYVANREGKPWFAIPELIENWLQTVNTESDRYESIGEEKIHYACSSHIEYEKIHPFTDGNGRTGRIFYNWQRLRLGLPIDIIKEKEKNKYYKWFI